MNQTLITGSLAGLYVLLKERGVQNVLLVVGKHLLKEEWFASFTENLPAQFRIIHAPDGLLQIGDVPLVADAGAVVAIGGGKVMDFAKGIIHRLGETVWFCAVPTTAGSGSEATPFAVFYSGKEKVSLEAPALLPQTVVLDESLLKNLSPKQKAVSGADAVAQCVESVWNVKSNERSEAFALEGLSTLWKELPQFIRSNDEGLAKKILYAAHLSGKAIAHTRTTGPHALSYYLTAHHGVPHGQAVALFLPLFFLYNNKPKTEGPLRRICGVLGAQNPESGFEACRHFFLSTGLATNFRDLGLTSLEVGALLNSVNHQRFANNPVPFDATELEALIRRYLL